MIEYGQKILVFLLALIGIIEFTAFLMRRFWRRKAKVRLLMLIPADGSGALEHDLRSARSIRRWWRRDIEIAVYDHGASPQDRALLFRLSEPMCARSELTKILEQMSG